MLQLWICSSLSQGICKKSRKEICKLLKKHDISSVNNRVNLSTLLHLTNKSVIPESGIMEWQHQRYVSRFCRPFPLPSPPLSSLHLPNFFCSTPFPHCGAWSHTLYTKEKCFSLFVTLYTSYHKQTHQRTKNHGHQINRASNVCRFLLGEVKSVPVIHIYEFAAKRKNVMLMLQENKALYCLRQLKKINNKNKNDDDDVYIYNDNDNNKHTF